MNAPVIGADLYMPDLHSLPKILRDLTAAAASGGDPAEGREGTSLALEEEPAAELVVVQA